MEDYNGLHLNRDLSHFYTTIEGNVSDSCVGRDEHSMQMRQQSQQSQSETETNSFSSHIHRYRSRTSVGRQLSNSEICRRRRESFAAVNCNNLSSSGSGLNVVSGLTLFCVYFVFIECVFHVLYYLLIQRFDRNIEFSENAVITDGTVGAFSVTNSGMY